MENSDKRRCKHVSVNSNSMIEKYRNEDDDKTDNWRKYRHGRDLSLCHDRTDRRQSNQSTDITTGYHCSTETYRPRKHQGVHSASHTKYLVSSIPEEAYRADNKNPRILRALRKQFYPNNVAVVRKARYKDEVDDDEESKYVDVELTGDDNVEIETSEEIVDEEHDNASEYSDKDYEEQEADDEVDEESDVLERRMDRLRAQRKCRLEPSLRVQRAFNIEKTRHHRGSKIGIGNDQERCCHTGVERDNVEVQSEEEDEEPNQLCDLTPYPLKKSTWKCQLSRHDKDNRNQGRNYVERYSNLNGTPSGSTRRTRRPRTTKPDLESSITSNRLTQESYRNNRCSRCGVSSGQTQKITSSRNANCRLRNNRYFTGVPIGDEDEGFEDPVPVIPYQTKPRRSKESRLPIYDPRDETRTMDAELGAIYKSCRSKHSRQLSNDFGERTRRNNRHDSAISSKNDNRYWLSK